MRHGLPLRANLIVEIRDVAGRIVATQRQHNLVVTAGRNLVRDLLKGDSAATLTHLALGTGTGAVAATDTTLGTEVFRGALTSLTAAAGKLTAVYYLGTGSANGNTLSEAGLLTASSGGVLYARALLASTIAKTAAISATFTWELTFGV
jgi:hypothetical protein